MEDKYEGLKPNMKPNLGCISHCRTAGWWQDADLGILDTIFNCEISRGYFVSTESGRWKCYVITDTMDSALSNIKDILPDTVR